jgi:hypothetical protein
MAAADRHGTVTGTDPGIRSVAVFDIALPSPCTNTVIMTDSTGPTAPGTGLVSVSTSAGTTGPVFITAFVSLTTGSVFTSGRSSTSLDRTIGVLRPSLNVPSIDPIRKGGAHSVRLIAGSARIFDDETPPLMKDEVTLSHFLLSSSFGQVSEEK